jgi:hypothetical protein
MAQGLRSVVLFDVEKKSERLWPATLSFFRLRFRFRSLIRSPRTERKQQTNHGPAGLKLKAIVQWRRSVIADTSSVHSQEAKKGVFTLLGLTEGDEVAGQHLGRVEDHPLLTTYTPPHCNYDE